MRRIQMRYADHVAGKITLYIRDEDLWRRARDASGPGGLSNAVHECLRHWLDRPEVTAAPPSISERARRLQKDAEALVRALESEERRQAPSRERRSRPPRS
jgi:hypothetical protein